MDVLFPTIFLIILSFIVLLNILTLPANWIMLVLICLWKFIGPNTVGMNTMFFVMLFGLALLGELIEYIAQSWGSKKYGASTSGMWIGLLGAFIGAIVGLPFLLGLGAFIGALIGAWIGCYFMEILNGRSRAEASRAAKGALIGRLLGIIIKCGIGITIIIITYHALLSPIDIHTILPSFTEELPSITTF